VVKLETLFEFLYDQGSFVKESSEKLDSKNQYALARLVGFFVLRIINEILAMQAEHISDNLPIDDLPPVLPHNLIHLRGREFNNIVVYHKSRLLSFWDEITIDIIEQQFKKLRLAYSIESALKTALNKCDANTGFEDDWAIVEGRRLVI
jgi:hypothetical protein